jgi:topoisomerase-4 subunit B
MASFRLGALRDLFGRSEEPKARKSEEQIEKPVVRAVRKPAEATDSYTAADIEVLEGLEPVRRRPGMYVGGTDEKALHHLFAEVIDNSMDEAVAGHATWIEVKVEEDGFLTVIDNGRGIPVDPHPKFKSKSALEVIMTTLHSGGKFDSKVYNTSGGLHGVGVSGRQRAVGLAGGGGRARPAALSHGVQPRRAAGQAEEASAPSRTGAAPASASGRTSRFSARGRTFKPPACPHGPLQGYLFGGVEIRWSCAPSLIKDDTPAEAVFSLPRLPQGISGSPSINGPTRVTEGHLRRARSTRKAGHGSVEWGGMLGRRRDGFLNSYVQHHPDAPRAARNENGLRSGAGAKGLRDSASGSATVAPAQVTCRSRAGYRLLGDAVGVHPRAPSSRARPRTSSPPGAARIVENAVRDAFDHWLADSPQQADRLLEWTIDQAEDRLKRKREKEVGPAVGDAQAAPARQAGGLLVQLQAGHRDLHRRGRLGRRLGQAGARSRRRRRCCRCAARSSTSPTPPRRRCRRTSCCPT